MGRRCPLGEPVPRPRREPAPRPERVRSQGAPRVVGSGALAWPGGLRLLGGELLQAARSGAAYFRPALILTTSAGCALTIASSWSHQACSAFRIGSTYLNWL